MSDELPLEEGVTVTRCTNCKTGYFPFRLMCANCGGADFADDKVLQGIVEESTVVRRAWGRVAENPKLLATVRTDDGQVIVVGLNGPVEDGGKVNLSQRGQAVYATAA